MKDSLQLEARKQSSRRAASLVAVFTFVLGFVVFNVAKMRAVPDSLVGATIATVVILISLVALGLWEDARSQRGH